jgi:hypothetical protein
MAKDFKISKAHGTCHQTGEPIQPGEEFVALVRDAGEELLREDYSLSAWEALSHQTLHETPDVLGIWRTRMPQAEEKKKLLVDDDLLVNLFDRLEGAEEPRRIHFRYVLTLVLMRKKLLVYESARPGADHTEIWTLRYRGSDRRTEVIDPGLDEDKIADVTGQLGQIMEGDFE